MRDYSTIFVRKDKQLYRLDVSKILYIETDGNYCHIYCVENNSHSVKLSLRKLSELLPEKKFKRVHKSYLIHLRYLRRINLNDRLAMVENREIPIGRTFIQDLTNHLVIL